MGLSVRTTNCLEETGILTVRDLLNATPRRLLSISNFGEKTLEEGLLSSGNIGFLSTQSGANRCLVFHDTTGLKGYLVRLTPDRLLS